VKIAVNQNPNYEMDNTSATFVEKTKNAIFVGNLVMGITAMIVKEKIKEDHYHHQK